nr:retrovirus-related Pol polyprotein from transposon TNT 1-94 [Tanacetum cinerariifolium]
MLSATKVPLFFWAEVIATSCFTQNRSLVIPRHEKTPYHIINGRKPSVKFFHIFGSLCYIVKDGENLDKMKEKGDACIFVGYSTQSRAYRVFNKRTRLIVETIHVNFDELPQTKGYAQKEGVDFKKSFAPVARLEAARLFIVLVQRGLHAQVRIVRTDNGTKFLNKTLYAYFASERIQHKTFVARTPEQNNVAERQNRTLVEATQTMLSATKVPLFFWAE